MLSPRCATCGLLSLLLVSAAAGQLGGIGGARPPQAPAQPRTISGVVINSVTGQPVARALVQAGQRAIFTDGEGRFEFAGVTDGFVIPSANKPGYFPPNSPLGWSANVPAGPVELKLIPEAILSGVVTDARGAPIEGVAVQLRPLGVNNGLKRWVPGNASTTNAEGEFRFAELQAGSYALQTMLRLDGPPEGDAVAGFAPVEYPVISPDGAGALILHPGDHLVADMHTSLERLYPVSGSMRGLPETGAGVSFTALTAGGAEINPISMQDPQSGEFRILLPSGSYELRAQATLQPPPSAGHINLPVQLFTQQSVTVSQGPVAGLSLAMQPLATLPVELSEERSAGARTGGQPVPLPDSSQINIMLFPAEANAGQAAYAAQWAGAPGQAAHSGGPLVVRDLLPGQYFVQAQPQPPWYVASALCGGTDLTREPLAITGSAAGCTLQLVLRDDTASLKVSLKDATAGHAAPALVYLVPLGNLTRDVQMLPTGPDGKGANEATAPGRYLAIATREMQQLAYRDPEALRRYETEGQRIDLTPGGSAEVQLDVIEGTP